MGQPLLKKEGFEDEAVPIAMDIDPVIDPVTATSG
jgi:hypothetical protein